jgi:hypothetical protein
MPETLTDHYLLEIQEKIDIRRQMPFLASNLLHRINAQKYHFLLAMRNALTDKS